MIRFEIGARPPAPETDGRTSEGLLARLARQIVRPERYQWWHAAGFGLAVNLLSLPFGIGRGDQAFYNSLKQAPFAPPGAAFGPVWLLNNALVLWGNLRLLNLPPETPYRRPLLLLQGASWAIFATFAPVYFGLRSPILAFSWTAGMYALTIASMLLASKIDRTIVLSFTTLVLWLSLATIVAAYQMLYNRDPFFGTAAWR